MSEDIIKAVEIQETKYGEKIVLQSPYEARYFIKALPFNTLSEEIAEHGSLRAKLESRDVAEGAIQATEDFSFSTGFQTHASWEPDALGEDDGAWTIDVLAWDEASDFFEFVGFETEVADDVNL